MRVFLLPSLFSFIQYYLCLKNDMTARVWYIVIHAVWPA
jgi:hypothetical protein